jgi:hypothetical protein
LRLCSPLRWTVWPPGAAVAARCRLHPAPEMSCDCGVYASATAPDAAPFAVCYGSSRRYPLARILGRVSLWGTVVECDRGWRAELAYPAGLFVGIRRRATERRVPLWRPRYARVPADELLDALGAYGVPVEQVGADSIPDLARALDAKP